MTTIMQGISSELRMCLSLKAHSYSHFLSYKVLQGTCNPQPILLILRGEHSTARELQLDATPTCSQDNFSIFVLGHHQPAPGAHGSRPRLAVIGGTSNQLDLEPTRLNTETMNQHVLYDYAPQLTF